MKSNSLRTLLLSLLFSLLVACSTVAGSGQAKLSGVTWKLTSFLNDQGQVVNAFPGVETTMKFEDGSVSGKAGCNSYSAKFKTNGENITFSEAISTMMACETPQGAMDQESAFLRALPSAAKFKVSGNTLEIYDKNGALLLTFNAAS